MLTLPAAAGPAVPGPGRTVRLFFFRGPGGTSPSLTGRCSPCCARTCTRPTWTPNAAATPPPAHPPAWQLMDLLAAGHTNAQIARRLGISEDRPHPPGKHLHDRLHVSSRTAAVTRALGPDRPPASRMAR